MNKHQWLHHEMQQWENKGFISAAQRQKIGEQYPIKVQQDIPWLSLLGALLIGLGVLSFIALNWSEIPYVGRGIIIALWMVAFSVLTIIYKNRQQQAASMITATILTLSFGAAQFLFAQMYHYTGDGQTTFLLWALCAFGFSFVYNSRFFYLLGHILAYIGQSMYINNYDMWFNNSPNIFSVKIGILQLLAILFVYFSYKEREHIQWVYISVFAFCGTWLATTSQIVTHVNVYNYLTNESYTSSFLLVLTYIVSIPTLYIIALMLRQSWSYYLKLVPIVAAIIVLAINTVATGIDNQVSLFFQEGNHLNTNYEWSALFIFALCVSVIAWKKRLLKSVKFRWEIALFFPWALLSHLLNDANYVLAILQIMFLWAYAVMQIRIGYQHMQTLRIVAATVLFLSTSILLYFVPFASYDYVFKTIVFMVSGGVLIYVSNRWRKQAKADVSVQ